MNSASFLELSCPIGDTWNCLNDPLLNAPIRQHLFLCHLYMLFRLCCVCDFYGLLLLISDF